MAENKNHNFGLSLKDMGLDASGNDLNDLLADAAQDDKQISIADEIAEITSVPDNDISVVEEMNENDTETNDGGVVDFNDFSIDDLDEALSKYGLENENGDLAANDQNHFDDKKQETEGNSLSVVEPIKNEDDFSYEQNNSSLEEHILSEDNVNENTEAFATEENMTDYEHSEQISQVEEQKIENEDTITLNDVAPADENSVKQKIFSPENQQIYDYLCWYDGSLGEKTYEISLTNMPEFLDYNPQIKVIHVNVDSPYGWNVFFENGTFMNLMDLKEFQERNGYLPGTNGKIIYGNKTTTFEQIEKIVVYEKPRYFFYNIKNK